MRGVMILDRPSADQTDDDIALPEALRWFVRSRATTAAAKSKREEQPQSIAFRKELPRDML